MMTSKGSGSIAKITRPRISAGVFPRTRLFRLLDNHRYYPAIWISASAGFGKTTLAASYLAEKKLPALWYQMDEGDADIATFFYYMGLAAANAAPRHKIPLPLLTPEYLQGIEAFTARYFENLYSRLKPPFLIVFDNCHLVPMNSLLHQVICIGLNTLPEGINIICISREDPPAQFARLRANGGLRLIDSEEIRFTFDESRSMMHMKGFDELPDKTAQYLHERTGGWAAGLVLLLERARIKGLDFMTSSNLLAEEVFDYFAQELFEKTDPEMREFLLKSSFLPKMTAPMAKHLTGFANSGNMLARLCRSNYFTQRDVQSQPFYQYHPLFREFLLSRIHDLMTQEQVFIKRRESARILEEAGQIEDAVRVLITAQDWEKLNHLVLTHALTIVRQGRSDTLDGWLRAFPLDLMDRSPWLLYWMGVSRMYHAPNEGYTSFNKAFQLFDHQQDLQGTLLSWSGAVNTLLVACNYELLGPWVEWLDNRINQGLVFFSLDIEAHVTSSMAGALVWRFPRRTDVEEWLDRAIRLSRETGDTNLSLQTFFHITAFYYCLGDFEGLGIIAKRMMEMAPPIETSPLSLIYYKTSQAIALAVSSVRDDLGLQFVREGLEMSEKSGIHLLDDTLFLMGFLAALNLGDMGVADEYLTKQGLDLDKKPQDHVGRYYFFYAWYRFLVDDIGPASAIAKEFEMIIVDNDFLNTQHLCHYFLAFLGQSERQHDEANRHILAAKALIPKAGEGYYFDYIYKLLEADIAAEMGEKKRALECLEKAMEIARKRRYKSLIFFWRPAKLSHLCAMALEHGIEVEYVKELIRTLDLPSEAAPAHLENWPWPVKIYTLGKFELYLDGNLMRFPGKAPKKPLEMLMAIISLGGRNIKIDKLMDLLWPEADGDKAQSAFKTTLLRLRSLMRNDQAILVHQSKVSLNPQYCWVDAWAFEKFADRVEAMDNPDYVTKIVEGNEAIALAEKAINIYGGAFLVGEESRPWVIPFREHLLKRFCSLVLETGTQLEKTGNLDHAAKCYSNAIDIGDILDEEPYRRLMTYYIRKDQPWKAMEVYARLTRILASMLGKKPSLNTVTIYRNLIERSSPR